MRLVPFFLSLSLGLAAQSPSGGLPWSSASPLPWQAVDCTPDSPPPPGQPSRGPLVVQISVEGALRILDEQGVILLRTGLPGRPIRFWRDGGFPVDPAPAPTFPRSSLIGQGVGRLPMGTPDFRENLKGLFWILCDDGKILTVIHPATARVAYLPLPGGRDQQIHFRPDALDVTQEARPGSKECWSVPWMALIPHLIHLGMESPASHPTGTALDPYPRM